MPHESAGQQVQPAGGSSPSHDEGALQLLSTAAAYASALLRDLVAGAKCALQQPIKEIGRMRHATFCRCWMRWHGASW